MLNYVNANYANKRLVGTIVTVKNKAAHIIEYGLKNVTYTELLTNEPKTAPIKDMDITPVKLGYVNMPRGFVSYIMRTPKREDWKQGLRPSTMRLVTEKGFELYPEEIPYNLLAKTIEGIFPKFKEVVKIIYQGEASSIAFNRSFAIQKDKTILYKGEYKIGEILNEKGVYRIFDGFEWSREELEEAIG